MNARQQKLLDQIKKIAVYLFIALEFTIYAYFCFRDIAYNDGCENVKYLSICLCALMQILLFKKRKMQNLLLILAMALTLIADVFLLLFETNERNNSIGIAFFVTVQLVYAIWLTINFYKSAHLSVIKKKRKIAFAVINALRIALVVLSVPIVNNIDGALSSTLAIVCFIMLLFNVACAFMQNKSSSNLLFAIGITLFALCDFSVGMSNVGTTLLNISFQARSVFNFLMW